MTECLSHTHTPHTPHTTQHTHTPHILFTHSLTYTHTHSHTLSLSHTHTHTHTHPETVSGDRMSLSLSDRRDACLCLLFKFSCTGTLAFFRDHHVVLPQIWANGETSPGDVCVWQSSLGRQSRCVRDHRPHHCCYRNTSMCAFVFSCRFQRGSICGCIRYQWWGPMDLRRFWSQWPSRTRWVSYILEYRCNAMKISYHDYSDGIVQIRWKC